MGSRKHSKAQRLVQQMAGQWIKKLQCFNVIIKKCDANGVLGVLGRENINHITTHAKRPAMKICVIAFVLHFNQTLDDGTLVELVANTHGQNHIVIFVAITNAVNARNSRHNHHIAPFDQAFGGR